MAIPWPLAALRLSGSQRAVERREGLIPSFGRLLLRPASEIVRIAERSLDLRRLVIFLVVVGLLRGLLESALILLRAGHFLITLTQPYALRSYAVTGSAFLVANVVTALVRWLMFAFVPFLLGRWLGGRGRFRDFLEVYGVAMGIYMLTILPDYMYLFWTLPAIRFQVSPAYSPVIGVGQILVSVWLVWFGYHTARVIHRLGRFDSLLVGLSLELVSLGSLVIGAQVFFNLPVIRDLGKDAMILTATAAFTLAAGVAGLLIWRAGRRLDSTTTMQRSDA